MTETVTVIKKEPTCAELVEQEWKDRQEDLKDPEYEALGFDYVEPHTWDNQPEGYWRWQFSWGGPSDELRGYVNEHGELHRLEYWYLDWGDGALFLVIALLLATHHPAAGLLLLCSYLLLKSVF